MHKKEVVYESSQARYNSHEANVKTKTKTKTAPSSPAQISFSNLKKKRRKKSERQLARSTKYIQIRAEK